jgi:hypothetical protein
MHSSWGQLPKQSRFEKCAYGTIVLFLVIGLLFFLLYRDHPLAAGGIGVWVLLFFSSILIWVYSRRFLALFSLQKLVKAGLFLLWLGLLLEPYEGGIKKDPSTFSYYFVCSGLAFLILPLLKMLVESALLRNVMGWLQDLGKNPMLAYVAGALLILPILSITGLKGYWDQLNQNPWQGLLKGVLFTGLVVWVTRFSVKKKWFWKT